MTINVVCRRDAINRNRLAPLALVFTHDRRRKFVGLGISEALVHWDFDKQQPTADCPDRAEIQFQITSKIREYEKKIKKLEVLEIPVTFDTLFEQNGKRINCTVGEYFKQIIERLEKVEKYSSASKHKVTLVLVSQFRSVNMRFDELDLTYLREFEIFLSQKGNVNNSCNYAAFQYCRLYLIEILHQTTTHCKCIQFTLCCILSKFYIKPQHEPLASHIPRCCILSKFYIKPQLRVPTTENVIRCILSKFYIKPQRMSNKEVIRKVVSYRNSTSNHNTMSDDEIARYVVSYRNSTSNHNDVRGLVDVHEVVSYRNSTSNHNPALITCAVSTLYLIEILHQTTTSDLQLKFIHCCILSKFYIKPQHSPDNNMNLCVVSYRNSTSNHNTSVVPPRVENVVSYRNSTSNHNDDIADARSRPVVSYRNSTSNHNILISRSVSIIVVSYRNSTSNHNMFPRVRPLRVVVSYRNSTSNHNIAFNDRLGRRVVSYRNSTSNHNVWLAKATHKRLYLIEILHQTTTSGLILIDKVLLTGCLPL